MRLSARPAPRAAGRVPVRDGSRIQCTLATPKISLKTYRSLNQQQYELPCNHYEPGPDFSAQGLIAVRGARLEDPKVASADYIQTTVRLTSLATSKERMSRRRAWKGQITPFCQN